jgi:hypothetical protein
MEQTVGRYVVSFQSQPFHHRTRYHCLALVLLAIILFAAIRYRLRAMPLERDEGEYAYAGQLILQGIPPLSACL